MGVFCMIPARSGSKRIPQKNIKDFLGKPLIFYSINAAKNAGIFEQIFVSSDGEEILKIADSFGATPILRDKNLADDNATTLEVSADFCKNLNLKNEDILCVIYPTAPLLKSEFLRLGLEKLKQNPTKNYAFSCAKFDYNPHRSFKLIDESPSMVFPNFTNTKSQDLDELFHDAGQFYFGKVSAFLEQKNIFDSGSIGVILPSIFVQDIDTMDDFAMAEIKYKILQSCGKI